MLIHLIAAARPNFMKIAPLYHALKKEPWANPMIVHTGQHYDLNMSDAFFKDLDLPEPDIHLCIGSGTHAEQTGQVMMAYEKVLLEHRPDLVIVVGDVNSTIACTLAASKISYNTFERSTVNRQRNARPLVAHIEAGLRSFDRTMPEEINRIVTDALADILWTPSEDADGNLIREGIPRDKIVRVGNIMIDSLEMFRPIIEKQKTCNDLGLKPGKYGVVTLHRPLNVDDSKTLRRLMGHLLNISRKIPLVFPVHPRTRKNMEHFGILRSNSNKNGVRLLEPLNYVAFMSLVFNSRLAIMDSGGIQEETTYLRIPCLTVRPNTERPITISQGTNQLCTPSDLENRVEDVLCTTSNKGQIPELWDGMSASRIIESIAQRFKNISVLNNWQVGN